MTNFQSTEAQEGNFNCLVFAFLAVLHLDLNLRKNKRDLSSGFQ